MTAERERYKAWDAKLVARQAALEEARSKHRRLREELDRQIEEWKKAKVPAALHNPLLITLLCSTPDHSTRLGGGG